MTPISLGQIRQNAQPAIQDFGATLPEDRIALRGGRFGTRTPSGLTVNFQDTRVETDFEARMVRPASVVLHMVLEGRVRGLIGQDVLDFGRRMDEPVRIVMSALARPAEFRRRLERGERLQKLSIVLSWDWLEARGIDRSQVMRGQLHRLESWVAAPADVARVRAFVSGQASSGPAQEALDLIERETLAMSVIRHVLGALLTETDGLRPQDRDRLLRMESFASRPGPLPALDAIAAVGGMSLSSMRRLFQKAYAQSVLARLRETRFEQASDALRRGMSVSKAAELAGYETATAFATAYRKKTGISPSLVQKDRKALADRSSG